jgi:hypothetical protein
VVVDVWVGPGTTVLKVTVSISCQLLLALRILNNLLVVVGRTVTVDVDVTVVVLHQLADRSSMGYNYDQNIPGLNDS